MKTNFFILCFASLKPLPLGGFLNIDNETQVSLLFTVTFSFTGSNNPPTSIRRWMPLDGHSTDEVECGLKHFRGEQYGKYHCPEYE
jgi:hypothetical protein